MYKIFYESIKDNAEMLKIFFEQKGRQSTHIHLDDLFNAYKAHDAEGQIWLGGNETREDKLDQAFYVLGEVQKRVLPMHMLKEFSRPGKLWTEALTFDARRVLRPQSCDVRYLIGKGDTRSLLTTLSDSRWGISSSLVRGELSRVFMQDFSPMRDNRNLNGIPSATSCDSDCNTFRRLLQIRTSDFTNEQIFMPVPSNKIQGGKKWRRPF